MGIDSFLEPLEARRGTAVFALLHWFHFQEFAALFYLNESQYCTKVSGCTLQLIALSLRVLAVGGTVGSSSTSFT